MNLEDVRIEHTLGRERAIAHLVVRPDGEGPLRESLTAGGWHLRGCESSRGGLNRRVS